HDMDTVVSKTTTAVAEAEAVAKELDPTFTPRRTGGAAPSPNDLSDRANVALNAINHHLPAPQDPRHAVLLPRLVKMMRTFGGDSVIASKLSDSEISAVLPPEEAKRWPARRGEVEAATT